MRVWAGCWREAACVLAVPMVIQVGLQLWDQRGGAWGAVGERLSAWAAVSVVWAAVAWLSLRHRARTSGITLTPDALTGHQTRQLRVPRPSVGWSDRMRTQLKAADRASVAAEKGSEEIWFHWRPGLRRHTVWGSITFDEPSGTVRLDLREGAVYTGVSGVRRGASFVALCQVARGLGLVEAES
ncbi:hypothetical protein R6V09_19795 [Streptomyces sp. W16]|uniref:hypothetical protein n=1 Tax=Streptomyces sp. W16 TaxID=3076631 RepID=UPI00295C3A54|nr:hypothetical protein [Streptomyces sp. W16]MDV9172334.1 hypothetical protein [Streptomyces sp. W16]